MSIESNKVGSMRGAVASVASIAVLLLLLGGTSTAVQARSLRQASAANSGGSDPGTFLVSYFDVFTNENNLRIVNPTKLNGSICAMIYVFDASEEMGECCGCPITPNELLYGQIQRDLLSRWATGNPAPGAGVIKIVSTLKTGSSCPFGDPACNKGGGFTSSPPIACDPTSESTQSPVANLSAWITHSEAVGTTTANSVEEFADEGSADSSEGAFLPQECENIISNGTGEGWCSCPIPDFHDRLT